jgi:flagellar biosynthesis chaperone FliJ
MNLKHSHEISTKRVDELLSKLKNVRSEIELLKTELFSVTDKLNPLEQSSPDLSSALHGTLVLAKSLQQTFEVVNKLKPKFTLKMSQLTQLISDMEEAQINAVKSEVALVQSNLDKDWK